MGDTVGLVSNLCLGAGRVVAALAWLVVPVCIPFLVGKDLKLGLGSFLAGTCCVGCRCPFLPLTFTLARPVNNLLGLLPRLLLLGFSILLSSFISLIAASISTGLSFILSSFISLIAASISTGSKSWVVSLLPLAVLRRAFKGSDDTWSLNLLSVTGATVTLLESFSGFCPLLRMPSLLLGASFTDGLRLGFKVVSSSCLIWLIISFVTSDGFVVVFLKLTLTILNENVEPTYK